MGLHQRCYLSQFRLGLGVLNYVRPWAKLFIAGVDQTTHLYQSGMTITDELNHLPNTADFRIRGLVPVKGQSVQVYLGGYDAAHLLFGGRILSVDQIFEGKAAAANLAYDCHCIDHTWLLDRRKVLAQYTNQSATDIILDIMSRFTSGFSVTRVTRGLPTIDKITFVNEDPSACLTKIMDRIGGYWFPDYSADINAFVTATESAGAITDASVRTARNIRQSIDLSQVATRIWCRGKSVSATSDVTAGMTSIPVADGTEFSASGGYAECGPQRFTYTGKSSEDGQGCVTSGIPGAGPNAPSPAYASLAGNLDEGEYRYVCTFVNASGETSAGGSAAVTIPAVTAPTNNMSVAGTTGGSLTALGTYIYRMTFGTAAGETEISTFGRSVTLVGAQNAVSLSSIDLSADPRVTKRKIYRRNPSSGVYQLLTTINDNVTTTYSDTAADGTLGAEPPAINDAATGRTTVGIPVGPLGTTSRKLYRTEVNGSVFKLQSTTADNTTLSVADNTADGSLGATFGTSSIGAGPGDTTLSVSDLSKFPSAGWVRAGSQVLSYTGRSASTGEGTLTGIPASGPGAITASLSAASSVVVEPHLVGIPASGVGAVRYAITRGDAVTLVAGVGDAAAQAVMAGLVGGDGVHEMVIAGDFSLTEATARGNAELTSRKDPLATVHLLSRDLTLASGRQLVITVTAPAIAGTFMIQRVTITDIGITGPNGSGMPTRTVECSTKRYSLEDLLRQIREQRAA